MSYSAALRAQLCARAEAWAARSHLPHYRSVGKQAPTILFEPTLSGSAHGNFQPDSWAAINAVPEWRARLQKPHSRKRALPYEKRAEAKELDSSNSSDALLMNCFCHPGAADVILAGLGLPAQMEQPDFGFSPRIELRDGSTDSTEVDMRIGQIFFEAKLTEADFTIRPRGHVYRYRGLETIFDVARLPATSTHFENYQLIRNVLAAAQHDAAFVLLIDHRRPDLLQNWNAVSASIVDPALAQRCTASTWQEVAAHAPAGLARFLDAKYGL